MTDAETYYEVAAPRTKPEKFLTIRAARTHANRNTTPENPCMVYEVTRNLVIDHREEATETP